MLQLSECWFFLESTTFIFNDNESYLLYNSESGYRILVRRTINLDLFIDGLKSVNNMYCLNMKDFCIDADIEQLIETIRQKYMGDIFEANNTASICIPPIFKCHENKGKSDISFLQGTSVMALVNSITFYLNGKCSCDCSYCSEFYKQFLCCRKDKSELLLKDVISKVEHCISTSSVSINFCGGNLFLYSEITELFNYLQKNKIKSNFYFNYLNWNEKYAHYLEKSVSYFHIYIHFPIIKEDLFSFLHSINQFKDKVQFIFIVSSEDECLLADRIVSGNNLNWYSIKPFYTGNNKSFFERNIYTNIEDLSASSPNKKELFKRQEINMYDFGKLIVSSSGTFYGNINYPRIGSIKEDLAKIVNKEIQEGKSWKRIRNQKPCDDCIYQYLCPSPSSYELVIGKNNLCNLK